MTIELAAGVLPIVVPIAFKLAFLELGSVWLIRLGIGLVL
jgi:hypothetical protein